MITYLATDLTNGVSADLGESTWQLLFVSNVCSFAFNKQMTKLFNR